MINTILLDFMIILLSKGDIMEKLREIYNFKGMEQRIDLLKGKVSIKKEKKCEISH